jgi:nitrogen fixation/metabolism regulation signal transduction histidine kinase
VNAAGYAFLGLTAIVAILVGVLAFAVMRFATAARDARRSLGDSPGDSVLIASALEEAFAQLKEKERATAARAEASERLSGQIVASLTSGLIVVDDDRHVKIVNPAAHRILRVAEEPAALETLLADVPALNDVIRESLDGQAPVVRREIAVTRGEETMHLGVTVSPLTGESGPQGAICLFSDLTSIVALEEQLRLKETLARLGELTAGLAHEFRNGLATIHGYGHLLDPETLPVPQRTYVEGIRSETQELGEVVTNFLKFARTEPLSLAPIDLRVLLARAADDVPTADVQIRGEFGIVDADEVLLRQAFSNLFRNSVEACTAAQRAAVIVVDGRFDPRNGSVVTTIRDNGPGIAAAALDKVFQPFFTTRPGGTGLGLSIVQKVIVSHNGRVSAGNHPEGGAMFTIAFPLRVPVSELSPHQ